MCVCVNMCYLYAKESFGCPGAGGKDGCEPLDVSAGDQAQLLHKSICFF